MDFGVGLSTACAYSKSGKDVYEGHIYAEVGSDPELALGSSWERDKLAEPQKDPGFIACLRNEEREKWALAVPRREGNGWKPFFPDILVVRKDGDRLVVDILDPHIHTNDDADTTALAALFKSKGG